MRRFWQALAQGFIPIWRRPDALVRKKDSSEPNMVANGAYAKYFTLYKELYRTLFQSFKDLKNI